MESLADCTDRLDGLESRAEWLEARIKQLVVGTDKAADLDLRVGRLEARVKRLGKVD